MTTTLRHHSPLGPITIAGVRGLVEPGTDFELPDHLAARLLEQDDVYELVSGDPRERDTQTVRQLRHELAERGLPYDGKKDDLVARAIESDKVAPFPVIDAEPAPVPPAPADPPTPPAGEESAPPEVPGDEAPDLEEAPAVPSTEDEPTPTTTTEPVTVQEGA